MSLPDLENKITKIETFSDALNVIEELMSVVRQLFSQNQELQKEIARLRKQSGNPTYRIEWIRVDKSYCKMNHDSFVKMRFFQLPIRYNFLLFNRASLTSL